MWGGAWSEEQVILPALSLCDAAMDSAPSDSDPPIVTASIRSQLGRAREPLADWNPTMEMTQPVKLPSLPGPGESESGSSGTSITGDFLFENIPAMIWIKDTENNIVKVNRWAAKAMGKKPEELAGRSEWDLHPNRADSYFKDDQRVIDSKQPIYGIIERVEIDRHDELWVVTDKIPILDSEGEVEGIVVITRDISTQKEAEAELVESQERLELALWGSEMGSWDLSLDGERMSVDEQARRILGFAEGENEFVFDDFLARVDTEDLEGLIQSLKKHLEDEEEIFEAEWKTASEDGEQRWVQQKGRVVQRSAEGEPLRLSGTVLDVSRRKDMEEEHDSLEKQMQHTQKLESLGVLAGGIAHDFNNLLTGIFSQSGIARMQLGEGNQRTADHLDKIEAAARRMAQLTRQMLAYSGRGKFEIRTFDLNEIIHEIVFLLKASIRKTAAYEMDLSEEAPFVEGDATQMHQVILNLITNASDAIGDQPGKIILRTGFADLGAEAVNEVPWGDELSAGRYSFVEVEDNGCGMDKETQGRLFEPFFTTKFTGRGLGMSAVLGIVRSHGGLIKVKTAPGAGTVFRVYTPATEAPEDVVRPEPAGEAEDRPSLEGGRFLIVDDEDVVRSVFSQAIEALGFEFEEAEDGPEAIELFKEHQKEEGEKERFSGVFLDMTMPKMNGHDVYRELQAIDPEVAVCIMSGFAAEEIASRFEQEEFSCFLPKPFQLSDIEAAILKMGQVA